MTRPTKRAVPPQDPPSRPLASVAVVTNGVILRGAGALDYWVRQKLWQDATTRRILKGVTP